ncbi:MAG: BRCT domain-containing protein [Candidatus Aenigmatarchaeota archaeon]
MKDRIKELEELISKYRESYYNGIPEISDYEYDKLEEELRSLDPNNPILSSVGFPVKRRKIKTPTFLGSLNKVKSKDLDQYLKSISYPIVISEKLDGISVFVEFDEDGVFQAGTRGNGYEGEDITEKARRIVKNNPKRKIILRGEALYIGELNGYVNRRNAVAGIMNRDDFKDLDKITIKFYQVLCSDIDPLEQLDLIKSLGFDTPKYYKFDQYSENIKSFLDQEFNKSDRDYDIDGFVIQSKNDIIAYKPDVEVKETEVLDIEWNVTRQGKIVPVIICNPVFLSGATVHRATAFNAKYVYDKKIGKGSRVKLIRSNCVIPYIVEASPGKFSPLEKCPNCGSEVSWKGVDLICSNKQCSKSNLLKIVYFLRVMGMEGISLGLIKKLNVNSIEEVFNLEKTNLGKILNEKFFEEREKILTTTPEKFLSAFGIPNVSYKTICEILKRYSFDQFLNLKKEDLAKIQNVGSVKAESIISYLPRIKQLYEFLKSKGLKFKNKVSNILEGKTFCITGTLSKPRKQFQEIIEANGGKLSSFNKKIDYLIVGENPTQWKIEQAKKYNIKMINEEEFLKML